MPNLWASKRLLYRAAEEDDSDFLLSIQNDPEAWPNASFAVPIPSSKKDTKALLELFHNKGYLAVIICLPAPAAETAGKPIPIGFVSLSPGEPSVAHHRRAGMGVNVARAYQGKGYGSEAILWALRWGFRFGNLHKIHLGAFGWNTGALQLYERLGFVKEVRTCARRVDCSPIACGRSANVCTRLCGRQSFVSTCGLMGGIGI